MMNPFLALMHRLLGCWQRCLLVLAFAFPGPLLGQQPAGSQSEARPAGKRPPNIVFIFSDDHALQAIGPYGSTINQTPQLDRLARGGMVFDRSYCANSICGPSRASVLTGTHSHINGFMRNGDRFDGSQITFPQLLQQAGYQTALIGKWHLVTKPTGFDHWEILPGQGHYYNPDFIQMDGSRKRYEGYCTDLIGDFSLQWLQDRDPNRPFLLMSQHKAPHRNWSPHPRHFGKYKLGSIPEPATLFDDHSGRSELLQENEMTIARHFHWAHDMKFQGDNAFPEHFVDGSGNAEYRRMTAAQKQQWDRYYEPENQAFLQQLRAGQLSDEAVTRWKFQRYLHDYLGCVAAVDENVGRILNYLEENNLADNTMVIYASDQGFYLGEYGWYDKRWMFEPSFQMPFLIRWPGVIEPGTRSSQMIQNIDYAPTLLQAAGVPVPERMQGESFLPILKNQGKPVDGWRDAIYYAYYENDAVHQVPMHDGVRTERYKAIFFPRTRQWNLFDLQTDPQELTSVHEVPSYQPILEQMQQRYQQLRATYQVNSAVIPASRGDEAWWKQRDREKRAEAQRGDYQLVFIGDSITQGWETTGKAVWDKTFGAIRSLNLGFSGDRTEHVLWRLQQKQLGPNRPRAAVVMIGTNNTGHLLQPPEQTAAGVREIVDTLRSASPTTKILLLGIFPRGADAEDPMRKLNLAINQQISQFADDRQVFYRDLSEVFLEDDQTLLRQVMPDLLHLSEAGYRRWAEAIVPLLQQWEVLP